MNEPKHKNRPVIERKQFYAILYNLLAQLQKDRNNFYNLGSFLLKDYPIASGCSIAKGLPLAFKKSSKARVLLPDDSYCRQTRFD